MKCKWCRAELPAIGPCPGPTGGHSELVITNGMIETADLRPGDKIRASLGTHFDKRPRVERPTPPESGVVAEVTRAYHEPGLTAMREPYYLEVTTKRVAWANNHFRADEMWHLEALAIAED